MGNCKGSAKRSRDWQADVQLVAVGRGIRFATVKARPDLRIDAVYRQLSLHSGALHSSSRCNRPGGMQVWVCVGLGVLAVPGQRVRSVSLEVCSLALQTIGTIGSMRIDAGHVDRETYDALVSMSIGYGVSDSTWW